MTSFTNDQNEIPSPFDPDKCEECGFPAFFAGIEDDDGEPYELHHCHCGNIKQLRTYTQDDGTPYPYRDDCA